MKQINYMYMLIVVFYLRVALNYKTFYNIKHTQTNDWKVMLLLNR